MAGNFAVSRANNVRATVPASGILLATSSDMPAVDLSMKEKQQTFSIWYFMATLLEIRLKQMEWIKKALGASPRGRFGEIQRR